MPTYDSLQPYLSRVGLLRNTYFVARGFWHFAEQSNTGPLQRGEWLVQVLIAAAVPIMDNSNAKRVLGFAPKYNDAAECALVQHCRLCKVLL